MADDYRKTTNNVIQEMNRSHIFRSFYTGGGQTKQDIVSTLHLCLPTVTQNIHQLVLEGLLYESGSVGNTGGRRAKTFSVVSDARVAIGLDITRNHITTVAVNLIGEVFYQDRIFCPFEFSDHYFRTLGERVAQAIRGGRLDEKKILGVGIGLPALVTEDHQNIFYGEILKITGSTCRDFSQYIPYPTALFNDANAACFAERWIRRDIPNLFYIMLSNNIGGAAIIDGRVYTGSTFRSSEVGHIRIDPNGRPCYCGQRGCLDTYCSATVLSSLTGGNLEQFFARLHEGHEECRRAWEEYLDNLCIAIVNVHTLFDGTIILGGYLGAYLEEYMDEIRSRVTGMCSFRPDKDFIVACSYKTEAIAAGSALYYINRFISAI